MMHSVYRAIAPYTTKDGSLIRERMHPEVSGHRAQSLAEATVKPGHATRHQRHHQTEEIYHFLRGCGQLPFDDAVRGVQAGDTVLSPPGRWHSVVRQGEDDLVFLCCRSPAYAHADTELQTSADGGDG